MEISSLISQHTPPSGYNEAANVRGTFPQPAKGLQPVWPDLAKFRQFSKNLEIFVNILKVYLIFGKVCEPTLGRFVCFWSKIHHCKWPNNKKTIWPSGHTAHLVHHNNYPHSVATSLHLLCKTTSACALRARGFTILRELRGVNEEKILNFQSLRGEKRSNSLISRILHVFSWNSKKHHASLTRFLSFFKKN